MYEDPRIGHSSVGRALLSVCKVFAYAGGFLLIAMVLLVVASVLGRGILSVPIPGDFELIELGSAMVVMLFLPYCHITRGNVSLDLLAHKMSRGMLRITDACGNLLLAIISALLVWRSVLGGIDLHSSRDATNILQIPLWLVFPVIVACFALLTVVSVLNLVIDLKGEHA